MQVFTMRSVTCADDTCQLPGAGNGILLSKRCIMTAATKPTAYYIINGITFYRLISSLALLFFILTGQVDVFKWMLAISFFTDAIDGYLARKFGVTSIFGARLDSAADDLTMIVAIVGLFILKPGFISQHYILITLLLGLYILQTVLALVKYGKITSFHTYLAKLAAVLQGVFLILVFFLPQPLMFLFYSAVIVTLVDLAEEILMIILLPQWEADVKSLYWVLKRRKA